MTLLSRKKLQITPPKALQAITPEELGRRRRVAQLARAWVAVAATSGCLLGGDALAEETFKPQWKAARPAVTVAKTTPAMQRTATERTSAPTVSPAAKPAPTAKSTVTRDVVVAGAEQGQPLKWRSPQSAQTPTTLTIDPQAKPLAGAADPEAISAVYREETSPAGDAVFNPFTVNAYGWDEGAKIVPTAASQPIDDPFVDPFGDAKPASSRYQPLTMQDTGSASPVPGFREESLPGFDSSPSDRPVLPDSIDEFQDPGPGNADFLGGPLALGPREGLEPCPLPSDLKLITEINVDIRPPAPPAAYGSEKVIDLPPACPLVSEPFVPRSWSMTTYTWKASALCHKPLYFEQPQLERYGHSWGPLVQPVLSGAHFFATVPLLPYKMGINPPWECVYPLGYYRPGNCAPYMIDPFPLSVRGALVEAGVVAGVVVGFP